MKATHLFSALSLLAPATAFAQPEANESTTSFDREVAPARDAFEIAIGTGYSQGVGKLGGNMLDLEDVAGPGGAVQLDIGYRVIPNLTLGAYGALAMFDQGDSIADNTNVFGVSAGVQAAWHFRPDRSVDPWVRLGTGWKALSVDPDNAEASALQGLELARLQIGVDYRFSPEVAITPVIGGSLGMFLAETTPMSDGYNEIEDKQVHFTGFAGIAGTFDVGGSR